MTWDEMRLLMSSGPSIEEPPPTKWNKPGPPRPAGFPPGNGAPLGQGPPSGAMPVQREEFAVPAPVARVVSSDFAKRPRTDETLAVTMPVQPPPGPPSVSYRVHRAARLLTEEATGLSPACLNELTRYVQATQLSHELAIVDPYMTMFDTFTTDTGTIVFVKESVPVSYFIVARHYKLTYTIQLVTGLWSRPRPYLTVSFRPYNGRDSTEYQSFGLMKEVDAYLTAEQKDRLKTHFSSLGIMTPEQVAADYSFVEGQLEIIGDVLK